MFEFSSPDGIEARTKMADTEIQLLARDIHDSGDAKFSAQFDTWLAGWVDWRDKTLDSYWQRLFGGSALEKELDQWIKNEEAWRAAFKSRGGKLTGPEPVQRPEDFTPEKFLSSIETVGTAVIVVAIAGAMILVLRETRSSYLCALSRRDPAFASRCFTTSGPRLMG
jgi:hypothetical protein